MNKHETDLCLTMFMYILNTVHIIFSLQINPRTADFPFIGLVKFYNSHTFLQITPTHSISENTSCPGACECKFSTTGQQTVPIVQSGLSVLLRGTLKLLLKLLIVEMERGESFVFLPLLRHSQLAQIIRACKNLILARLLIRLYFKNMKMLLKVVIKSLV